MDLSRMPPRQSSSRQPGLEAKERANELRHLLNKAAHAYYVPLCIQGVRKNGLVDSGAAITMMTFAATYSSHLNDIGVQVSAVAVLRRTPMRW